MKRPVSSIPAGPVESESGAQRRVVAAIKREIAAGVHTPGSRLPSTRALAGEWGLSRTTVTAAFEQLAAEGFLETRPGARARVAVGLARPESIQGNKPAPRSTELSAYGRRLASAAPIPWTPQPFALDFRYGELAGGDFPTLAWRRALAEAVAKRPTRLRYGDPRGLPELRTALQGYLWRARGLRCEADDILVVNGSQQGFDLCTRLLLDPGDRVVIEDPGYNLARQAFLTAGAELSPQPVDREGMQTAKLPPARLAFVTPSHQLPLGSILSAPRRLGLLAWAARHGAFVIEDDYDAEYRHGVGPVPPLRSLDQAGSVIYLGTVSKTLSPTLRLGYLVLPPALREVFARAKRMVDRHTPELEQAALAELIEGGAYERHVRRIRRRNGERRAALLKALRERLGERVTTAGTDAGLHVLAWINGLPQARESELTERAASASLGLYGVSGLYDRPDDPERRAGLVIGYAALDENQIAAGIARLDGLLREFGA
ncbi:GntR family transcriptional regulator / MocR family aminotransferase [Bosea sp. CRIB-10]|uniref:MocR-like pyridoxine biosynthesis transcription factor PdxR n=1 Tax=Bosea sp. CRIB-10 TaxID=378404 RepID=UPI0008EF89C3|nr:PLP-dependent aminotransferase family protein [Bosea sp. CRIB-10]SFC56158.1 GntR family transcriptional regulator / MocR family aminotransferase [Bosea sp. CRIB-10]